MKFVLCALACVLGLTNYVNAATVWLNSPTGFTVSSDIGLSVKIEYLDPDPGFTYFFGYTDSTYLVFQSATLGTSEETPQPVIGNVYSIGLLAAGTPLEFDFGTRGTDVAIFGDEIISSAGTAMFAGFGTDVLSMHLTSNVSSLKVATLRFGESSALNHLSGGGGGGGINPPAPVPLPAAAWLLLSGIAGLGFLGRRRRSAPA